MTFWDAAGIAARKTSRWDFYTTIVSSVKNVANSRSMRFKLSNVRDQCNFFRNIFNIRYSICKKYYKWMHIFLKITYQLKDREKYVIVEESVSRGKVNEVNKDL